MGAPCPLPLTQTAFAASTNCDFQQRTVSHVGAAAFFASISSRWFCELNNSVNTDVSRGPCLMLAYTTMQALRCATIPGADSMS